MKSGTYNILAHVKDAADKESSQKQYKIFILKDKAVINPLLIQFLERVQYYFPLLNRILNI